jgi:hypothetical protein
MVLPVCVLDGALYNACACSPERDKRNGKGDTQCLGTVRGLHAVVGCWAVLSCLASLMMLPIFDKPLTTGPC